jgi:hypothetical protein
LGLFNTCFKRRFGASPGQWRKKAVPNNHGPPGSGAPVPNCSLRLKGLCPLADQPQHRDAVSPPPSQTRKAVPAKPSISARPLNEKTEMSLLPRQQRLNQGAPAETLAAKR